MRASLKPILDVLGEPGARFVVPVFQRVYAWTRADCAQLIDDALEAGTAGAPHFMGTLIYLPEREMDADGLRTISLIDGQQRFTTITLLLVALRDRLRGRGDAAAAARAQELCERYLALPDGTGKLVLSDADEATLAHIVGGAALPEEPSKYLLENLKYFEGRLGAEGFDGEALQRGLENLKVIAVELGPEDAAQQVFESLNAKGRPLTTADLIRNTLLLEYGSDEQERLLALYWAPIEDAFRQFAPDQDIYIDAALHRWLIGAAPEVRSGKRGDLYRAFKRYLDHNTGSTLEDVLKSLSNSCLAFAAEPTSPENKAHIDWVIDKAKGMVSQRKLFGGLK